METIDQLRRKSGGSGGMNWRIVNRLLSEEERTLFAGETPND